ncbi:MAG: HD domain-containing protein [Bacillota bacterium]
MENETKKRIITMDDVENHPMVIACIRQADSNLGVLGYTEHGFRHTDMVANTAYRILKNLGYSRREAELAAIAGYLHDIGNVVERSHHYYIGALIAMNILKDLGMEEREITEVAAAIGNHDEISGHPVSVCSAAVILADKADVHRLRVRNPSFVKFDIHDRVNYAVEESVLELSPEERVITLKLKIDNNISKVLEYFEIFLSRMVLCRRAADFLSARFSLVINDAQLL